MIPPDENLDPRLEEMLQAFRAPIPDNPQAALQGRQAFLAQAAQYSLQPVRKGFAEKPSVSSLRSRWLTFSRSLSQGWNKKGLRFSPLFATFVLVFCILVISGGVVVVAAQASLPDEPLYPVKLNSEALAVLLNPDPKERILLEVDHAGRRLDEITVLDTRRVRSTDTLYRYAEQMDAALIAAARLDDPDLRGTLVQIYPKLKEQERSTIMLSGDTANQAARLAQQRLAWVEAGLTDPNGFRRQMKKLFEGTPSLPGLPPSARESQQPLKPAVTGTNPPQLATTPQATLTPNRGIQPTRGSGYGYSATFQSTGGAGFRYGQLSTATSVGTIEPTPFPQSTRKATQSSQKENSPGNGEDEDHGPGQGEGSGESGGSGGNGGGGKQP